jgi:hypothetical protein
LKTQTVVGVVTRKVSVARDGAAVGRVSGPEARAVGRSGPSGRGARAWALQPRTARPFTQGRTSPLRPARCPRLGPRRPSAIQPRSTRGARGLVCTAGFDGVSQPRSTRLQVSCSCPESKALIHLDASAPGLCSKVSSGVRISSG